MYTTRDTHSGQFPRHAILTATNSSSDRLALPIKPSLIPRLYLYPLPTPHPLFRPLSQLNSGSVSKVIVNSDGSLAASAGYDKTVRLWDLQSLASSEVMSLTGHSAPVLEVAWGGGCLLTGARDGAALLWDLGRGRPSQRLSQHRGHVTAVSWHPHLGLGGGGGERERERERARARNAWCERVICDA